MNLNELRDKAYETAVKHGWHNESKSNEHCLCLVVSELMEAVEADRKNKHADRSRFKSDYEDEEPHDDRNFAYNFKEYIKDSVEDELADTAIRLLDLAGLRGVSMEVCDGFMGVKVEELKCTFTEFCLSLCSLLSSPEETLEDKVNYGIVALTKYTEQKGIDLMWHIKQKMKYNELRPYMHGGKKY